tara:strand:- start:391 stop:693 length:303 start_codon:yes stop_codon:yes gene_type:complete
MGVLGALQTGIDGVGKESIVNANSITLKAKEVTSTKNTTLRVTGLSTGATWVISVVVRPGVSARDMYPPAVDINPPLQTGTTISTPPTANFIWALDEFGA